jgi:hypothetical protein
MPNNKKNKFKKFFYYLFFFIISIYIILWSSIGSKNFDQIKKLIPNNNKFLIKKYLFPYKYINKLENEILNNKSRSPISEIFFAVKNELDFKKSLLSFQTKKKDIELLSNNLILEKYNLSGHFHAGINHAIPGTGFIDFYENNLIVLSARGIIGFSKESDEKKILFGQIKNNLNEFLGLEQFYKDSWFSFKDLLIKDDKIFVSFTEEIKEDCWNTSLVFGKINYIEIKFKKLFSSDECVHSKFNTDQEFNAHQSGGKIISLDDNHVLLSVGDYRSRFLAQQKNNVNGKIIKIDLNNESYELFSMGHRNPQGLLLDDQENIILETEHGPKGGDEVNIIHLKNTINKYIPNYGWPISSLGEHYNDPNGDKYKKYPLYKSHIDNGFIEPIKSFTPSIGISEIEKIGKRKYVFGSLRSKSLYFFNLDENHNLKDIQQVVVNERIRDLKFYENRLYLILED